MKNWLVALVLFCTVSAWGLAATKPLEPTPDQSRTVIEILDDLASKHYRNQNIDDDLSERFLTAYLETLDPVRSFFLRSDIEEFQDWQHQLDDFLRRGDLSPGFKIFNRYRERALARLDANIALLESDFVFNFDLDEYLEADRREAPWLTNDKEAEDLWRRRMKDSLLSLKISGKEAGDARELLIKRYTRQKQQIEQSDEQDVLQYYINALTLLFDPHTNYLSPRIMDRFNLSMSLSLEGIGAVLQMEDEHTKVVRIVPGGPADKQGELQPEDHIVGVAQGEKGEMVDVIGWRLDDVVDLIRGNKGTTVRLEIIPSKGKSSDITREIVIVRDKVELEEQAAKSRILEIPVGESIYRLGVIDIPTFYMDFDAFRNRDPNFKSSTKDVRKLLLELMNKKIDGLVIDLRNNGGGSLQEATTLTDLFVDEGPVVQIRNSQNHISRYYRSRHKALYRGPLTVLINRLSASASEIFAAAIQDYGRGLIVGSQSYGKGTVQVMIPLKEGELKLTESKFYRISGESTQHRGVVPDIELPGYYDPGEIGESSEENALPWDRIHPVSHKDFANLTGFLPTLRSLHDERVKTDADYIFLQDELALDEKYNDLSPVPLNEKTRLQEGRKREENFLQIVNKHRKATGLPIYANVEAWKEAKEPGDATSAWHKDAVGENMSNPGDPATDEGGGEAEKDELDPLLHEAGRILIDYILVSGSEETRVVLSEGK